MRAEVAPSPVEKSPYSRVTVYADNGNIMGTLLAYTDEAAQLSDLINGARFACPNCGAPFGHQCLGGCPGRLAYRATCRGCGAEFFHTDKCQVAGGAVLASHTWPTRELPARGHTGYTPAPRGGQAPAEHPGQLALVAPSDPS
jgi:hypothetical protein